MEAVKIKVNAKINLSLDVVGKREDGYHTLDMLMTSVDVCDIIFASRSGECAVTMDGVEAASDNTAVKALTLLNEKYGIAMRAEISKGIPFSAGMGGSSADASGIFFCAHRLYGIPLEELTQLALKVGADVPYMMYGGGARVTGIGDCVSAREIPRMTLAICQKAIGASTKDIYARYDIIGGGEKNRNYHNDLEKAACSLAPEISAAREDLLKFTDRVFMTGSGSAYVGVFGSEDGARECIDALDGYLFKTVARTSEKGIEILDEY